MKCELKFIITIILLNLACRLCLSSGFHNHSTILIIPFTRLYKGRDGELKYKSIRKSLRTDLKRIKSHTKIHR